MLGIKKYLAAGIVACAMTTSAQAVTFTNNINDSFTFTFSWDDTPFGEETGLFGIAFDFDLTILDYSGTGSNVTGYYVDDAAGNRLTTDIGSCSSAALITAGGCNLFAASDPLGEVVLSGVSAGEYNFGIFESATPPNGSLTFGVSKTAVVPLPAGGLLLLTALGGIAATRRRKN